VEYEIGASSQRTALLPHLAEADHRQWHTYLSDSGIKDQIKEKLEPGGTSDWLGSADQSRTGRTGMSVCQLIENSRESYLFKSISGRSFFLKFRLQLFE